MSKDNLRPSSSMTILPTEASMLDWFGGGRGVWKSAVYIRPHGLWFLPATMISSAEQQQISGVPKGYLDRLVS